MTYKQTGYFFLILLMGVSHLNADALNIRFKNFGLEDGLTQGTISDIVKGPSGFIWIGTADGLHRFDGHSFKVFRGGNEQYSIQDNYIRTLFMCQDGSLLIGTNSGLFYRFNRFTESFKEILLTTEGVRNNAPIRDVTQFGKNVIVATEGNGLFVVNSEDEVIQNITTANTLLKNNVVYCLSKQNNGIVQIGTNNGVNYINSSLEVKINYQLNELDKSQITSVIQDHQKTVIGTYGQGTFVWNSKGELNAIDLPKWKKIRFVNDVLLDHNVLWIASDGGGLVKYKLKEQTSRLFLNNPLLPNSVMSNNVTSLFSDQKGLFMAGTINGLSLFNSNLKLFKLVQEFREGNSFSNNNVYSIFQDRSGMHWFGTIQSGLVQFNINTNQFKLIPEIKTEEGTTRAIRNMYQTKEGQMLVGTRDAGVFSYDQTDNVFTSFNGQDSFRLKGRIVRKIVEDQKGRLWVGTEQGLNYYDRDKKGFRNFKIHEGYNVKNAVYEIIPYQSNQLIVGNFKGGLSLFDCGKGEFTSLNQGNHDTKLNNRNVMSLLRYNEDTLLIGTYGGGLNIYNLRTKRYSSITEKDGMPNNSVYAILEGLPGQIWMSTNKGLCMYDISTGELSTFGLYQYLQDFEYNEGAFLKDKNGLIFFGGVNGVNYFNPKELSGKHSEFSAKIVNVSTLKREFKPILAYDSFPQIEINYNENLLTIEFASLAFGFDNAIEYEYKMEGFDQDWIQSGKRNTAYYTKLDPGHYSFLVKASEKNRTSSSITRMKVTVLAPYWKKAWFIALLTFVIGGLIGLFIYVRTKSIKKDYRHKLMELELKALRGQMNPHFIFNSLNSIQYYILKKEPKPAYMYLSKFSGLMRKILQNSSERYIALQEEVETLSLYLDLERLRMDDQLEFNIKVAPEINTKSWAIPTMLVQPFVENAIIHGLMPKDNDRKLDIRFSKVKDGLKTVIEDNGIGIEASKLNNESRVKKHKSAGMKLTKERLEMLNDNKGKAKLTIEDIVVNGETKGTRVILITPYINHAEE